MSTSDLLFYIWSESTSDSRFMIIIWGSDDDKTLPGSYPHRNYVVCVVYNIIVEKSGDATDAGRDKHPGKILSQCIAMDAGWLSFPIWWLIPLSRRRWYGEWDVQNWPHNLNFGVCGVFEWSWALYCSWQGWVVNSFNTLGMQTKMAQSSVLGQNRINQLASGMNSSWTDWLNNFLIWFGKNVDCNVWRLQHDLVF